MGSNFTQLGSKFTQSMSNFTYRGRSNLSQLRSNFSPNYTYSILITRFKWKFLANIKLLEPNSILQIQDILHKLLVQPFLIKF